MNHKYFIPLIGLIWTNEFDTTLHRIEEPLKTKLMIKHFFVHGASFYTLMAIIFMWLFKH